MAINAKSTYGDPYSFRNYMGVGLGASIVDAAPFYDGIRIKKSLSGSGSIYSGSSRTDYVVSHVFEETYSRIPVRGDMSYGTPIESGIPNIRAAGYAATNTVATIPAESECLIYVEGGFDGSFLPIGFILTYPARDAEIIGTYEIYNDDVLSSSGDIMEAMDLGPPIFHFSGVPEARSRQNRWGFAVDVDPDVGSVDISGWTVAEWRDLRGIQTMSPYVNLTSPYHRADITLELEVF